MLIKLAFKLKELIIDQDQKFTLGHLDLISLILELY